MKAREFMLRFADRVMFGTDIFSDKEDRDFFRRPIRRSENPLGDVSCEAFPYPSPTTTPKTPEVPS